MQKLFRGPGKVFLPKSDLLSIYGTHFIVEDDINLGQVIFQELKRLNHEVELVENAELPW